MPSGLIDGGWAQGAGTPIRSIEAATGEPIEPGVAASTDEELDRACRVADAAFGLFRDLPPETRASFLESIADEIMAIGEPLIDTVMRESGLPRARLEGERGRTCGQLRLFAEVLREGSWLGARIDHALPDRAPLPRPDLRMRMVPVGPVAVFGASNFPLAFSVAGGDTASALAAGCPVIAKAHPAHLGTSVLVARAVDAARRAHGLPAGVFQLVVGEKAVGAALVGDARIAAVGFTGSRAGGTALMRAAAARPVPIPVYAEMSSINPVLLFPNALAARGNVIATSFAQALTLGAGQFCTKPGLVVAIDGPELDRFVDEAASAVATIPAATMLTPGIHEAYTQAIGERGASSRIRGQGAAPAKPYEAHAHIFEVDAKTFCSDSRLQDEIFGPAALVVRCGDLAEMERVVAALEGQLTVALHIDEDDHEAAGRLIPSLERVAGRLLINGFGTGVEVAHAMVHGGPYPATSDGRSTSVGSLAIERFLRPVCYQAMPDALLPEALRDANPWKVPVRREGRMETAPL